MAIIRSANPGSSNRCYTHLQVSLCYGCSLADALWLYPVALQQKSQPMKANIKWLTTRRVSTTVISQPLLLSTVQHICPFQDRQTILHTKGSKLLCNLRHHERMLWNCIPSVINHLQHRAIQPCMRILSSRAKPIEP